MSLKWLLFRLAAAFAVTTLIGGIVYLHVECGLWTKPSSYPTWGWEQSVPYLDVRRSALVN